MKVPCGFSLPCLFPPLAASACALTFDEWRAVHFSTAELADPAVSGTEANPAGDGLGNLLKYAFDLDPHAATIAGAPVVSRS